jgi:hypothetical protein
MTRRILLSLLSALVWAQESAQRLVRGRLRQGKEGATGVLDSGGKTIVLSGDEPTIGVLQDPRLNGADFEAGGKFAEPGRFEIDPIHTRSLFVHQDGKRLMVTYWCDICYIRTFTPGVCQCCQDWTRLDLREPDAPDPKP